MVKRKSVWEHKSKFKGKPFKGSYSFHRGERVFELTQITIGKKRVITFESHQAAKNLGWKIVR